jgi:hypothetical protein
MTDRKSKREPENMVELSDEKVGFVLEPTQIEMGSAYALSISYDEDENPIVDVKTFGAVDIAKLRKDIKRVYPKAQIRNLNQMPSVTIVRRNKSKESAKRKRNATRT